MAEQHVRLDVNNAKQRVGRCFQVKYGEALVNFGEQLLRLPAIHKNGFYIELRQDIV